MQKYATFSLPLALVCSVVTLGANALIGAALIVCMFVPTATLPLIYIEFLHLPILLLALPLVVALALTPLGLKYALNDTVKLPQFQLVEHDVTKPAPAKTITRQPVTEEHLLKAA